MFGRAGGATRTLKVNEYRAHLNYAMQKFEVRPSSVKLRAGIFIDDILA
jgi:hypothetical protein